MSVKITLKFIRITTKITRKYQICIDEIPAFKNPYTSYKGNGYIREVYKEYDEYLKEKLANKDTELINELQKLANVAIKYGKLELFSLHTSRAYICPTSTIKDCIEKTINQLANA
jgi:hypothetical protein